MTGILSRTSIGEMPKSFSMSKVMCLGSFYGTIESFESSNNSSFDSSKYSSFDCFDCFEYPLLLRIFIVSGSLSRGILSILKTF